jgi:hypothetical protein
LAGDQIAQQERSINAAELALAVHIISVSDIANFWAGVVLRDVHVTVETAGAVGLCDALSASGVAELAWVVSDVAEVFLWAGELAFSGAVEAEVGTGAVFDAFGGKDVGVVSDWEWGAAFDAWAIVQEQARLARRAAQFCVTH